MRSVRCRLRGRESEAAMSQVLRRMTDQYEFALCGLQNCRQPLHMVFTNDQPIYLSFAADDLTDPSKSDGSWEVRCEAGHVILVPVDDGEPWHVFGQCRCEPTDPPAPDDECGHGDLARLRAVLAGS